MNLTIDLSPESTKQPIWYNQYSLLGRLGRTSITKKWGTKCDWKCYTILVYCTYLIRKCIYNHKHFRPKAWIFMGGGCPLKIISEKAQCPRPRNLPSIGDYCNKQCEAQALQAQVAVCLMRYLLQTELGRHRLHHHPVAEPKSNDEQKASKLCSLSVPYFERQMLLHEFHWKKIVQYQGSADGFPPDIRICFELT